MVSGTDEFYRKDLVKMKQIPDEFGGNILDILDLWRKKDELEYNLAQEKCISEGKEKGFDTSFYDIKNEDGTYIFNLDQMSEIMEGLEHGVDVSCYCCLDNNNEPCFNDSAMHYIRCALEDKKDISCIFQFREDGRCVFSPTYILMLTDAYNEYGVTDELRRSAAQVKDGRPMYSIEKTKEIVHGPYLHKRPYLQKRAVDSQTARHNTRMANLSSEFDFDEDTDDNCIDFGD